MTRNFRIEQTSSVGSSGSLMPITRDSNVFMQSDTGSMGTSRKDLLMTNQELAQANQRLQGKVQKLSSAYQAVEQQNVSLRDRCLKLQNRVDELKSFLASIKMDVGQRVPPMRLIAGHLYEVASFLESLDQSIEMGGFGQEDPLCNVGDQQAPVPSQNIALGRTYRRAGTERKPISLEKIKETVEVINQWKII